MEIFIGNLTCEDLNITLIAVNKKAAVGEDTHYDLGNMKCIISPSNTGNYIFTVPHEAQDRIYDHFEYKS